jgi:hypothetical protein
MRRWLAAVLLLSGCATRLLDGDGGTTGDGAMNAAVQYQAFSVPTNLPRVSVQKVDGGNQRCTTVLLVGQPPSQPPTGLTVPAGWSVERAWQQAITNGACAQLTPPTGASMPLSITGAISFDSPTVPMKVTVHAMLAFPGGSSEAMDADNVAIQAGTQ